MAITVNCNLTGWRAHLEGKLLGMPVDDHLDTLRGEGPPNVDGTITRVRVL